MTWSKPKEAVVGEKKDGDIFVAPSTDTNAEPVMPE